jgi:hypothetical protein
MKAVVKNFMAVAVGFGVLFSCCEVNGASQRDLYKRRTAMQESGKIRKWKERSWGSAYIYNTAHYSVKTNTSYTTCRYIANIMELVYTNYRNLFNFKRSIPRLQVNAYATMEEFREVADKVGLSKMASGFFSPFEGGAIQLPYVENKGLHPSVTLFHEGTHQFVAYAIDMPIPSQYKKFFDSAVSTLPSTPIWLNEGLATYCETAWFTGDRLDIGRLNVSRLRQLKSMLYRNTLPDVREVVSRRYGQPYYAEHYAVGWGIVYYLRHDASAIKRLRRRKKLTEYLERAKKSFLDGDPVRSFKEKFMPDGAPEKDFIIQFRNHIGEESLKAFQEIIVGKNKDIVEWQKKWAEWILKLDAGRAYGGAGEPGKSGGRF